MKAAHELSPATNSVSVSSKFGDTERISDNMLARLINDHQAPYCTADDCDACSTRRALLELQQARASIEAHVMRMTGESFSGEPAAQPGENFTLAQIAEFCGYLSGAIPELHQIHPDRLWTAFEDYLVASLPSSETKVEQ
jgi:hypothetical protein